MADHDPDQELPEDDLCDEVEQIDIARPHDEGQSSKTKQPIRPAPPLPYGTETKQIAQNQVSSAESAITNVQSESTCSGDNFEFDEDFTDIESYGVLSTAGVDRLSRPVFVFYACNLPQRESGLHDKMLRYIFKTMDAIVENDYSIVYFHHGLHRDTKPSLSWLRKAYSSFDRKYKKNLKALFVVHATIFVRTVMTLLRPVISKKFGRKITFIHELSALDEHIHLTQLEIPAVIREFDEKLSRSRRQKMMATTHRSAGVFGTPLEEVEKIHSEYNIPKIIVDAVEFLRREALDVEGIFRRSANANTIKELKLRANQGDDLDFTVYGDVHIPAVLIKTFLRDLPEPLLTFEKYQTVLELAGLDDADPKKVERTHEFFESLPSRHYDPIVVGPNLLWSKDMAANLSTMGQINVFTQFVISNASSIFPNHAAAEE
eukprot:gene7181-480_t